MARCAALGVRRRTVGRSGGRPAHRAAAGGARGADRPRAGRRAPRGGAARSGGPHRRSIRCGNGCTPADAGPVPGRAAGRRPGGLRARPRRAGRRTRAPAQRRNCGSSSRRSCSSDPISGRPQRVSPSPAAALRPSVVRSPCASRPSSAGRRTWRGSASLLRRPPAGDRPRPRRRGQDEPGAGGGPRHSPTSSRRRRLVRLAGVADPDLRARSRR